MERRRWRSFIKSGSSPIGYMAMDDRIYAKTIRAVCSIGKYHDIEVEDDVTAYMKYENGATGLFITSTGEAPGTNRFEIIGDYGKIVVENEDIITFHQLDTIRT